MRRMPDNTTVDDCIMLMDHLSAKDKTSASQDNQTISPDQLRRWFQGSIELGCLPLARTLHLLLLRSVHDEGQREDLAEELSNSYIAEKEQTQSLVDGVWSRTIDSYDEADLSELIRALLIHDLPDLASSLYRGLSISDPSAHLRTAMEWPALNKTTAPDCSTSSKQPSIFEQIEALTGNNNKELCDELLREGSTYLYFQACLVHPSLLEPRRAYDEQGQLNFNHPAVDAPSMQWENNLPEASTWLNQLDDIINTATTNTADFTTSSAQSWTHWPEGIEHPKTITIRIGLTSTADQHWRTSDGEWRKDTIRLAQDYSAQSLISQLLDQLQSMAGNGGMTDEVALQFACDVAYGFSRNKQCDIIDLGADNLLHLPIILQAPEPIQFAIIDGTPQDLVQAVRGTSRSVYPRPIPFVFEDDTLLKICERWAALNTILKESIPDERLTIVQLH